MKLVLVVVAVLTLAGGARAADVQMVMLPATEDLSLPFWCDWGYDWDERCYWDDSNRLGVGGVDDKVWRAGIRFSLGSLPAGARVVTAELSVWYDETCVAPRRRTVPCDGRGFELDAHPIFTSRWRSEREVEFGPAVAVAHLDPFARPCRLVWDVTDTVAAWQAGELANDGLLLKLSDDEEAFDAGGPAFPSSSFADAALLPQLAVWYSTP